MSTAAPRDDERDLLAAEVALGLLEGDALADARRLQVADPGFGRLVEEWEQRLAPLLDEIPAAEPDPALWERIRRAVASLPEGGAVVLQMRRKLGLWRGYAAAATAVAASLALVIGYQSTRDAAPPVVQPARPPVLVAALASAETNISLTVAFDASDRSILVTPARVTGAAGHDHELWLIPVGGKPISLGLVRAAAPHRLAVAPQVATLFRGRASVALSVEPVGGSPTGQPTGPVVAAGELLQI